MSIKIVVEIWRTKVSFFSYPIFFYLATTADPDVYLEHLQRGEVDDTSYGDPYVVLSQHQMQNLGKLCWHLEWCHQ